MAQASGITRLMATSTKRPPAKKTTAKTKQRGASAPPSASSTPRPTLAPTDVPGVFRNSAGTLVNEEGVALCLLEAKTAEAHDLSAVVGHEVKTPAQFLKAVSLDPRVGLAVRLEAAKAAAPYTDRKMPQGVDGGLGADGTALPIHVEIALPPALMKELSDTELAAFDKILGLLKAHGLSSKEGS